MKSILACAFLGAFTILLAGCAGKDAGSAPAITGSETAAAQYTCPSCKESVSWVYGSWPESPKGQTTARKVVKHDCPSCKREWSGNLGTTSTCAACAEEHLTCPLCKAHGS